MNRGTTARRIEVACLGEAMAQLVPQRGDIESADNFALFHGGAESNVAVGLARLGTTVAWVSRVGSDALGRRLTRAIGGEGVDVSGVSVDPMRATGLFTKDVNGAERPVTYYRTNSAASVLSGADFEIAFAMQPRVLHTTGVTATLSEISRRAVEESVAMSRRKGALMSFDVNYRPSLWDDPKRASETLGMIAGRSDLLFVGLDEAAALWGCSSADEVRERFSAPQTVVVKDGSREAVAFNGDSRSAVPAPRVNVVEPVGAGDAFAAGFLHCFLQSRAVPESLILGHRLASIVLKSRSDLGDRARVGNLGDVVENGTHTLKEGLM